MSFAELRDPQIESQVEIEQAELQSTVDATIFSASRPPSASIPLVSTLRLFIPHLPMV